MWIVDADKLSFLEVNPAATHILGFSESELKVLPINNIQFKDSQESFASLIKYSKEKKESAGWSERESSPCLSPASERFAPAGLF